MNNIYKKALEEAGIDAVQRNKYAREAYRGDIAMLKSFLSAMPDRYDSAGHYPDEETYKAAENLVYWSMRVNVDLQQIYETSLGVNQAKELLYKYKCREADSAKGGDNHVD